MMLAKIPEDLQRSLPRTFEDPQKSCSRSLFRILKEPSQVPLGCFKDPYKDLSQDSSKIFIAES